MPIPVACPGCGANYNLKDEMAGMTLRCRQCQGILKVPTQAVQEGRPAPPAPSPIMAPPALPVATPAPPPLPGGRRQRDDYDDDDYDRDDYQRPGEGLDPAFQRDKFLLRQKHFSINQKYYIQDEKGRDILFVERPIHFAQSCLAAFVGIAGMLGTIAVFVAIGFGVRAAAGDRSELWPVLFGFFGFLVGLFAMIALLLWLIPKRHISFYADDRKRDLLLEVLQDKKFAPINATYTALDADGRVLATFRKNYLYNMFRKRWYCYYPDGELMVMAMEDSLVLSLLRRFIGPLFGILRTNFIITRPDGERVVGEFIRKFTLLDRYVLDMSRDRGCYVDRRVAVALGVLLDTGEHR